MAPLKLLLRTGCVLLGVCLFGCAGAILEPAPGATLVPGVERAAQATTANIKLVAESDAWNAPDSVRYEVTALRLTVKNIGSESLKVRYEGFELVSSDGERFRSLRPEKVIIRGKKRSLGLDPDAPERADAAALRRTNEETDEQKAVRAQLLAESLKDTWLARGEQTQGFVYFRWVPPSKNTVSLQAGVASAHSGQALAPLQIPFRMRE